MHYVREFDGKPDMFATPPPQGDKQDFGFLFDLNKDGQVDYVVFNGGPIFYEDTEFYWMNYHWIDSNYDGRIDIAVNNAVSLGARKSLPQKGLTAWIYDSNFDGYADSAGYLGGGITEVIEEENGTLTVNYFTDEKSISIGKEPIFESKVMDIINAAIK